MVKVIYRSKAAPSILTRSAREYIRPTIRDALECNPNLDVDQLTDILIGELEENRIIDLGQTHVLASEISSIIKKMQSKYRD